MRALYMVLFLAFIACNKVGSKFEIPRAEVAADGWEYYTNAVPLSNRNAAKFSPGQGSPEAATTHFFASLIRKDKAYEKVVPLVLNRDLNEALNAYEKWDFKWVELIGRKQISPKEYRIKVDMTVGFEGQEESDKDDLTLTEIDGKWFLKTLPR